MLQEITRETVQQYTQIARGGQLEFAMRPAGCGIEGKESGGRGVAGFFIDVG
jgi:hypothetical protein